MRAYIFTDTLNRGLRHFGFKPKHIINLTDVGHLTDDADAGEDKVEQQARKERCSTEEIISLAIKDFFQILLKCIYLLSITISLVQQNIFKNKLN